MNLVFAALAGLLAWTIFRLDEQPSLAPDSEYYLAAGRQTPVPAPFAYRWLIPWLLRTDQTAWKIATFMGIMLQAVSIAWYCDDWRAAVWLAGLPAVWRLAVRHPILIDPVPFGYAIFIGAFVKHGGDPRLALLLAVLAGGMKEWAPIWAAIYAGNPLLLFGLIGAFPGWLKARKADPKTDNPWITAPWKTAAKMRRHNWLNWQLVLAPWGLLLPIAVWKGDWRVWLALAVAHLPWLRASDYNRIAAWAAPVLIAAALTWDTSLWPLVLLLHVLNPYRGA